MPLFRSRSRSRSRKDSSPPLPDVKPYRSNSIGRTQSNDSLRSINSTKSNRLKSFFKSPIVHNLDDQLDKLHISSRENSVSPCKDHHDERPVVKKRISTIAETSSNYSTDTDAYSSEEEDNEDEYDDDSCSDDDDEIHEHPIKLKKYSLDQQHHDLTVLLSNMVTLGLFKSHIKSYKELKEIANIESQNTYSLLDSNNKIYKLSKSLNGNSIIDVNQISLINNLTQKIQDLIIKKNYQLITNEKSLFQRYGIINQVIGKGAYGLIKIIDPDTSSSSSSSTTTTGSPKFDMNRNLYAVKQWFRKKNESNDIFIERILSEFVIQSTLNNDHLLSSVDLMCQLPLSSNYSDLQFSQIMSCNQGGDLYSYLMNPMDINNKSVNFISLDEIDCWIKQITIGLNYMHNHGVSHCDLKLENILISYKPTGPDGNIKMILKISDFGKSFVFKTKFDNNEQLLNNSNGLLIGTLPYIPPEEFLSSKTSKGIPFSSIKKDCWCLGILIIVLYNIRRLYYSGSNSSIELQERFRNFTNDSTTTTSTRTTTTTTSTTTDEDTDNEGGVHLSSVDIQGCGFIWGTTDFKSLTDKSYKDKLFNEYVHKRMIANYDSITKEWLIKKQGKFKQIDNICYISNTSKDHNVVEQIKNDNNDDLNELRVMMIYKLLDINPDSRMNTGDLLSSDWLDVIDIC